MKGTKTLGKKGSRERRHILTDNQMNDELADPSQGMAAADTHRLVGVHIGRPRYRCDWAHSTSAKVVVDSDVTWHPIFSVIQAFKRGLPK